MRRSEVSPGPWCSGAPWCRVQGAPWCRVRHLVVSCRTMVHLVHCTIPIVIGVLCDRPCLSLVNCPLRISSVVELMFKR